jgi:hypothetical protein
VFIALRELDKYRLEKNTFRLAAVTELLQDEICVLLDSASFHNYLRIDAGREHLFGGECDIAIYEGGITRL